MAVVLFNVQLAPGSYCVADPVSKSSFVLPQVHGSVGEPWWLWVEDPLNDHIYHSEYFLLQKKQVWLSGFLSSSEACG